MLARARDADYLDEAIYLHMLDENLAPEYIEYRRGHSARFVDYLLKLIAPSRKPME